MQCFLTSTEILCLVLLSVKKLLIAVFLARTQELCMWEGFLSRNTSEI